MTQLSVSVGQHSSAGRKAINQDRHGFCVPDGAERSNKGICIALADGIGSSEVSQEASAASINGFIEDYYATPESWSVITSGQRVLQSINAWLYSRSRHSEFRYDPDKGYVCTFSGMIFKANKAYLFHAGDSRIYRVTQTQLQQLTTDHQQTESDQEAYLTRALGLEAGFHCDACDLDIGPADTFLLMTDGAYRYLSEQQIMDTLQLHRDDLQQAAESLIEMALAAGSNDNLTVQVVRIDTLPASDLLPVQAQVQLPAPPDLTPQMQIDGYEIVRELYVSARSHVFLARDLDSHTLVALKTLSTDLEDDPRAIERFLMEDWIARRLDNPHCLKAFDKQRPRRYLYTVTEYIEGQTLSQWLRDNPEPGLDEVRRIIEQVGKGLQAMHRKEMIHQDIRPDNILLDRDGTVKIIDYGATRIAGIAELGIETELILGTAQFTAPEYFLGQAGSAQSDIFSLGVLSYHLLSHTLPYGNAVAKTYNIAAQKKLHYQSLLQANRKVPFWVDDSIRKAVQIQPHRRYQEVAEFVFDLNHPNPAFLNKARPPLMDRDPVLFWKCISAVLLLVIVYQSLPAQ